LHPRYDLKADSQIIDWQKENNVTNWIAYIPSSEEEAHMADDGGPDVVSAQIEEFMVGDVEVRISRYRIRASSDFIDVRREALNEMRERFENNPTEELKSRIESLQQFIDDMEQTGTYPTKGVGMSWSPDYPIDHPLTQEEIEELSQEVFREASAVVEERSRYGRLQEPASTQQGEEQSTKQQFVDDNIIPNGPNESMVSDVIERRDEEEIYAPPPEFSEAMEEQIYPPDADWQSPQDVLSGESPIIPYQFREIQPGLDEKKVDIPEFSENEMIELLDWLASEYREDLPDERKDEIFFQFIEKLNKNQHSKDGEYFKNRRRVPPGIDEDMDEDEGNREPN